MPWLQVKELTQVGPILLAPYVRTKEPGISGYFPQAAYDGVMGRYGDLAYGGQKEKITPVRHATIATWPGDDADTEIGVEEGSERLIDGQFLTFSALSNRRYGHCDYINSDTLTMVGQPFNLSAPASLTVRSRMRNGYLYNHIGMSEGIPVHMRPMHATSNYRANFDAQLFSALVEARKSPLHNILRDAILLFNQANTDSPTMTPNLEVVMLKAAYETLFEISHDKKEFRQAFSRHFENTPRSQEWPEGAITEQTWRTRWPNNVHRPLDAWSQDFCNVRNSNAHGSSGPVKHDDPVWSLGNHLMFASWMFPLVVKQLLANAGLFKLCRTDRDYQEQFEKFFAEDILSLTSFEKNYWTEIDEEISMTDVARRMYPSEDGNATL